MTDTSRMEKFKLELPEEIFLLLALRAFLLLHSLSG